MKTKMRFALLAMLFLTAVNTFALKVKVFTLKSLIEEADVIVTG